MQPKKLKYRILIIVLLLGSFSALCFFRINNLDSGIELNCYYFLAQFINPYLTKIMRLLTRIGDVYGLIIIIFVILIIPKFRWQYGIFLACSVFLSAYLNSILKIFFMKERPNILRLIPISGYSFPSAHAMNNATLYLLMIFLVSRSVRNKNIKFFVTSLCYFLLFTISLSRIYLGVHTFNDVISGWLLGAVIAIIFDTIHQYFIKTPLAN